MAWHAQEMSFAGQTGGRAWSANMDVRLGGVLCGCARGLLSESDPPHEYDNLMTVTIRVQVLPTSIATHKAPDPAPRMPTCRHEHQLGHHSDRDGNCDHTRA